MILKLPHFLLPVAMFETLSTKCLNVFEQAKHPIVMDNPKEISNFSQEWKKFKRAFMKSKDPFNPFVWIFRLTSALGNDLREKTGLRWRPIIPVLGISLVLLISGSYFWKLRLELIYPEWCVAENLETTESRFCAWLYFHDCLVVYITIMILVYYTCASMQSPGILITKKFDGDRRRQNFTFKWISLDNDEKILLSYGELKSMFDETDSRRRHGVHYHPSPDASFCDKCDALRPPRCHHCRICNRCILQYDHHCVWLNNCVGYNNVRSFVLLLVYLTLGCWYGVFALYKPFYDPLQEILRKHGGLFSYIQKYMADDLTDLKGLFDFPSMHELQETLFFSEKSIPVHAVVDIVFPFLFAVGGTLSVFLGTHVKYILKAQTTLEHRIVLAHQYEVFMKKLKSQSTLSNEFGKWMNPFDQGSYYRNWVQTMGDDWLYLLLPIIITPPLPFTPSSDRLIAKKRS
jgi:DHHC palmitoyltransferase